MDASHSELEAIRRILADLMARVYRIERELRIRTESAAEPSTVEPTQPSPAKPVVDEVTSANSAPPVLPPPRIPPIATTPFKTEIDSDLESRIGSHWLNRIGIAAVLIGISYFLKYAFDNNWIGPAGRVNIGLLAGIGRVERALSRQGLQSLLLLAQSRGNRNTLSLGVGRISGLQPDSQWPCLCHDACRDLGHRRHGLGAGRTTAGRVRAYRGLLHTTSAVNRAEPRGGFVFLCNLARPGHVVPGHVQALATTPRHELRGHAVALYRVVFQLLFPQSAGSYSDLCHVVFRHLCNRTPGHATAGRGSSAVGFDSRGSGVRECRSLFPPGLRRDRRSRQDGHGVVRFGVGCRLHFSQPPGSYQKDHSRR